MHIPDGFINAPTAAVAGVVSAGGVAYALRVARERLSERQVPMIGLTAAFVFAVQMINFPIGLGTSGHLIGGALAAILLGPWMATLVLAVVLIVQALGFADGGITALGANVSLMGLVAGIGGYLLFRGLMAVLPRTRRGFLTATAVTSWATVVLASGLAAVYLVLNGFPPATVPVMLGLHALIGIGEAAITTAVVGAVLASRPDLVATGHLLGVPSRRRGSSRSFVLAGLGVALFAGVVVSGFASGAPDGLESAVLRTTCDGDVACLEQRAGDPNAQAPLPDYEMTPLSGSVGVGATFAVGTAIVMARRRWHRSDEAAAAARDDSLTKVG